MLNCLSQLQQNHQKPQRISPDVEREFSLVKRHYMKAGCYKSEYGKSVTTQNVNRNRLIIPH